MAISPAAAVGISLSTAAVAAAASAANAQLQNRNISEAAGRAAETNKAQATLAARNQTQTLARRALTIQSAIRGAASGRTGQSTRSVEIATIAQALDEQTNVGRNLYSAFDSIESQRGVQIASSYQYPGFAGFSGGLQGLQLGVSATAPYTDTGGTFWKTS